MIPRTLFGPEHEEFRRQFRRFLEQEVTPNRKRWEAQQHVDRDIWKRAGELGFLCTAIPEEYGGAGGDRLYSTILIEEAAYACDSSLGFALHSDICAPYILNFGTDEQKRHWLPKLASGEVISAIAMTEPGTGSDLQAVKTTAVADGDDYVINGSKIFITNGYLSDLVIVVAKTGGSGKGSQDISLILVEADRSGFTKGRPLEKIGMKGQDTAELFFSDVRVPRSNLLGSVEGQGFIMLMKELAWERMIIAITSQAAAETSWRLAKDYTDQRNVFGKPVAAYQNTRFKLAEMRAEIAIGRVFVDRCLELVLKNALAPDAAAAAKFWITEMQSRVTDQCLQLHGGYGYMLEYPIARIYADTRAQRIYGGTNEIMRELVARFM
ncbi:acyl-CoA dehydrogenase [Burkholderia singularis]|uniref:Acyl-[acyl-carrier-protein] dehydrogenase MbtN n=1 Tax=Burkholderia singularis TaxID=1503053 RepID=A0A103E0G0_9BURK|nr:acyl-CoA dehydrogenase family protein [Burkholderia singularis]KVE26043.1 acyl-CoA dehydrogenase [Burkholderia singularis]